MADSDGRMFTEGETYALVDEAVKRQTADLTTETESLKAQKAQLEADLDVLGQEKAAAIAARDAAEQALEDFKTQKAQEEKRDARTKAFADVAPDLELDEKRVARLLAYTDEEFEAHLDDLRQVAAKKPPMNDGDADDKDAKNKKQKAGDLPRESAAFQGDAPTGDSTTTPVLGVLRARAAMKA